MEIPASTPTSDGKFPWPSEDSARSRLLDSFVLSGVFRNERANELLEHYATAKEQLLKIEEASLKADLEALDEETQALHKERTDADQERAKLAEEKQQNAAKADELQLQAQELTTQRRHLLSGLLSKRLTYPIRLFQRKHETIAQLSRMTADVLLETEKHALQVETARLELARERSKVEAEKYQLRKPEFDRRIAYLEGQKKGVQQHFANLDEYLGKLRLFGITRTTAGFLVWSGYLVFTAFGWFAGPIVKSLLGDSTGKLEGLEGLIALLGDALRALLTTFKIPGTFLAVVTIPLLICLLLFLVVWLADLLLSQFDAHWKAKVKSDRRKHQDDFSPWRWIQPKHTSRADYTQLLAKLPFVYLCLLIPLAVAFFLALVPGASMLATGQVPADVARLLEERLDSFIHAFLGVILCILVAASMMLYTTRVIEPRTRSLLFQENAPRLSKTFLANWELALLLLSALLFVILSSTMKVKNPASGLWLLLVLNGLGVSYGLLYRGLFKDYTALRKELATYSDEIEAYSALPLPEFDSEELDPYKERLKQLREEIDSLWRKTEFWETPFGGNMARMARWLRRDDFKKLGDGAVLVKLIPLDDLLEPEVVIELRQISLRIERCEAELAALRARDQEISARLATLSQVSVDSRLTDLRKQRQERHRRFIEAISNLTSSYLDVRSGCEGAHQLGSSLRQGIA